MIWSATSARRVFARPRRCKEVHPLGKAPVLQDDDLTLAESATILAYLADRYGDGRFAAGAGTADAAIHDEWLQYAESSAGPADHDDAARRDVRRSARRSPRFANPELKKAFDHIEARIGSGGPYLMGEPSRSPTSSSPI